MIKLNQQDYEHVLFAVSEALGEKVAAHTSAGWAIPDELAAEVYEEMMDYITLNCLGDHYRMTDFGRALEETAMRVFEMSGG